MDFKINKKIVSRNSYGMDKSNNLSSKVYNSFRKEFRSQYGNYISNSNSINDYHEKKKCFILKEIIIIFLKYKKKI